MQQLSDEWFSARIGKLTGSNVGAVLGLNPCKTRQDVIRNMVRETLGAESEFTGNIATRHGQNNEAGAIIDFMIETELDVTPAPFVLLDDGEYWLGASPDGYTSDGGLIEVKAPFSLRNAVKPVPFKTLAEQPHYAAQIQVQLHVTDMPHCWFFQWCPADTRTEKVERDEDWLNSNISALKQFYSEYLHELEHNAAEHLTPKRVTIDTPAAHKMVAEWDELSEAIDNATARKKDLLADMVAMAGEKDAEFAGRKLTLTKRAGSVSYAKAIAELLPDADLEKWRGKAGESWGLR